MAYTNRRSPQDDVKRLREKLEFDFVGGYLFWGEEEYLKNYYREALKNKVRDQGMTEFNLVSVSFEKGAELSNISDAIDTPPVFAPNKLIEVTGFDLSTLKKNEEKELLDILSRRADDTIILFYFHSDELDLSTKKAKERAIIRALSETLFFVEFPRQSRDKLMSWTDKFFTAESLHISDVSINRMIDLCDFSMTRLKSETDKLVCRAKFEKVAEVPAEWVSEMVKPSAENELYELTEAIAARDGRKAASVFENVVSQNFEPVVIFGAISKTVIQLSVLLSAKEAGISSANAAATAGIFGAQAWQADKYYRLLSSRTSEGMRASIDACFECDRALKGESTNKALALNTLISALVSERCK